MKPLNEVNKLAAQHSTTLVCSWSYAEVARYIETFRLFENKTASDIKERVDPDYLSRVTGETDCRACRMAWPGSVHAHCMPSLPRPTLQTR